jgi:uncharacterized protein (TIGR03118 family)
MTNIAVRALAQSLGLALAGLVSLSTTLPAQQAQHYAQTNLVSDTMGMAMTTDPNLVNPWGISRSSGSPWWTSDNGVGVATLFTGAGAAVPLVVTIPPGDPSSGAAGTPTGQIFNGTNDFQLTAGHPALFIFATGDGTISGWNPAVNPTSAVIMVNTKGASAFNGLAVATVVDPTSHASFNFLYAADFRRARVSVYDASFHGISLGEDAFRDERLPKGFAPINVQNIGGNLYVAFAMRDSARHDREGGSGMGFVDVFSPTGRLLNRLQSGPWFNAPWGMTQAPSDFGAYSHNILVGQFGSGQILAFDPVTGHFKGALNDATNAPITIDGLRGINFGGGTTSGPSTTLFFAAGPDLGAHGLFGTITAVENVLGGDH